MPIYEYHCPGCDNLFEDWCQRIDDNKAKECPVCGKMADRIISHTSFALKGEGWYVTEYGSKKGINEPSGKEASTDKGASAAKDTSNTPASGGSAGTDSGATAAPSTPATTS